MEILIASTQSRTFFRRVLVQPAHRQECSAWRQERRKDRTGMRERSGKHRQLQRGRANKSQALMSKPRTVLLPTKFKSNNSCQVHASPPRRHRRRKERRRGLIARQPPPPLKRQRHSPEANAPPLTLASGVGFWRAQESCGVTTTNSCYGSWSSVSSWPHALLCPWLQGELTQAHLAFEGHSIKVEAVRNDGGVLRQEVLLSIMRPPTDGRDRPAGHAPCAGRANEYEQERV